MAGNQATRVLITGASGFIGAHVTRLALAAGERVTILALPDDPLSRLRDVVGSIEVIRGDLTFPETFARALRELQPEACIHLAWYAEPGKYLDAIENVSSLLGSLNLIEILAAEHCTHLLAVGTCAEYDTDAGLLSESSPTRPATLYAASKLSLYLMASVLAARAGMELAWARLFYLFGPGEDPRRLVPSLIQALRQGQEFPATAGEQVRDYLHVEDVASGLWMLSERRAEGIYNVCSGIPVMVRELLETVGGILERTDLIRLGATPYRGWEPPFICGESTKLRETGWLPKYCLRTGLEHTVKWWACQPGQ
jgi:nucleoside-diphosphate-sugar epimerase